jgi:BirA family biotin operon repressor/biotin-[acetyl-CoA-carboxylase] ligase
MNAHFIALDAPRLVGMIRQVNSRIRAEVHPVIDSTSDELRRRASAGDDIDGLAVVAETQTAGRGRQGRNWVDRVGRSLLFSLGWTTTLGPEALAGLTLAVGVAVCTALEQNGASGVKLKWPNDVLHAHRKLGGILVESIAGAQGGATVVIGVGINVTLDAAMRGEVDAAITDLGQAGWRGSREQTIAGMLCALDAALARFASEGFSPFRASWLARHALQQRNVSVRRAGIEVAAGRAIGVDEQGALLLQTPTGVRRFVSGELTLRPG